MLNTVTFFLGFDDSTRYGFDPVVFFKDVVTVNSLRSFCGTSTFSFISFYRFENDIEENIYESAVLKLKSDFTSSVLHIANTITFLNKKFRIFHARFLSSVFRGFEFFFSFFIFVLLISLLPIILLALNCSKTHNGLMFL